MIINASNKLKLGFYQSVLVLWRSFSYMGVRRKLYVLGCLMSMTELAISYISPYLYKQLVDIVTLGYSTKVIQTVSLLVAGLL